jgi:hypothetical protein
MYHVTQVEPGRSMDESAGANAPVVEMSGPKRIIIIYHTQV